MIIEEEIIKLLNKYGFNSQKKEPFLYKKKDQLGIFYTYKDVIYGNISRIFMGKDLEEIEDFLEKYYWYKKNGDKYKVTIKLDNYEIENPKVCFIKDKKELTKEEMLQLSQKKDKEIEKKEESESKYIKKLKRTLLILLEVIEEKIKNQNVTYQNLIKLTNDYVEKQNELNNLLTAQDKKKREKLNPLKEEEINEEYKKSLKKIKENFLSLEEKEPLENNMNYLTNYLKTLEIEEGFLKNKYELIKLPLQIELMKEKIEKVKEQEEKKKGLFGKKESLEELLQKVEQDCTLKDIVSYTQYKENEMNRIEEKYTVIPDLDPRTIGDYFVEFDNLKIKEIDLEQKKENKKSFEESMIYLENSFNARPKKEQELLMEILYISKITLQDIDYFINQLNNPNNIMIKIKYFKNIDTRSIEHCKKSIEEEIKELASIKEDKLLEDINIFFKEEEKIQKKQYLKASTKRILAPRQNKGKNDITYYATLKKDSHIYFVPNEIISDLSQDDLLVVEQKKPFFFINLEKSAILDENSDILKVVELEEKKIVENNKTVVNEVKCKKKQAYKTVIIERKHNE